MPKKNLPKISVKTPLKARRRRRRTVPKISVKTPPKIRRRRRKAAKKLTPAERAALVKILPKSRRAVAGELSRQRKKVEKIARTPARDALQHARKKQALSREAKKLAGLTGVARAQRERRQGRHAGVAPVSKDEAHRRKKVVETELREVKKDISRNLPTVRKGNAAVRASQRTKISTLVTKKKVLEDRKRLLDQGADIKKPRRIDPTKTPRPRKDLKLPPTYKAPEESETVIIMRMLASMVPRGVKETQESYETRLRGLTERVLVRVARMSKIGGKDRSEIIKQAIEETLLEDKPAIDSEVSSTGGLAHDPSAEAMEPFVDQVAGDLEAAAQDVAPPVPAEDPSPEEVEQIVEVARTEESLAAQAPKEMADEVREDVILADQPLEGLVTPRNVAIAGGAVLLGLLVWRLS